MKHDARGGSAVPSVRITTYERWVEIGMSRIGRATYPHRISDTARIRPPVFGRREVNGCF